ncbi:uncharacterized protein [Montipora capricornis]|uniref:uncharacterized protein isoform X2 n=1 Tax=Montipora capricornis TaxID=246305 RepID=UPI0035F16DF3
MEEPEVVLSGGDGFIPTDVHRDRVRAVCLIEIKNQETKKLKKGSGFYAKVTLEGKEVYGIFTCNHVVGSESEAKNVEVIFDLEGKNPGESTVILRPDDTFRTHKVLDYTFVAIHKDSLDYFVKSQITPIMLDQEINLTMGEFISIVQHPGGKPKQLSQDRISSVDRPYIKYEADTEPGSSGSPVFTSKDMKAIAIHVPGREGAFNKGTLLSEILSHLQQGTYTQHCHGDPSSELKNNKKNKKRKRPSSHGLGEPPLDQGPSKVARTIKEGTPSDTELEDLSLNIGDAWKHLGRRLGFTEAQLIGFHKQNEEYSEKPYQMLLHWKRKNGCDATYKILHDALCDARVDQRGLAEQLCYHSE